jgi:hypothetical protein
MGSNSTAALKSVKMALLTLMVGLNLLLLLLLCAFKTEAVA